MINANEIVPDWSESSKKQFNSRLNVLQTMLQDIDLDINDPQTYHSLSFSQIQEMLAKSGKKQSTIENYINTLSTLFSYFNGDVQTYKHLLEYSKQLNSVKTSSVVAFDTDDYLKQIEKVMLESDDTNIKVLARISLCDELAGIRMDDLVSTRLLASEEYSWIDIENKTWHIKAKYTKNNKDRSFKIPVDFLEFLKTLKRSWLLCTKQGSPYKNPRYMLQKFRKEFGFNYGQLRKTAVQSISDQNDLSLNKKKANVLGHRVETEMTRYTKSDKKMYILRGLPGSGKSTLANKLGGVILSTDDFWLDDKGNYVFNRSMLSKAHRWNQDRCANECSKGTPVIIIDNTNCTRFEFSTYEHLAKKYDYQLIIKEPDTDWKYDPIKCHEKCTHGVTLSIIQMMRERWQDIPQTKLKPKIVVKPTKLKTKIKVKPKIIAK